MGKKLYIFVRAETDDWGKSPAPGTVTVTTMATGRLADFVSWAVDFEMYTEIIILEVSKKKNLR